MRHEIKALFDHVKVKYKASDIRIFLSRTIFCLTSHISYLISILLLVFFLSSCVNDLNKVKEISSNEVGTIVEPTTGVDLIMSDSAKVTIHLTAPLILQYNPQNPKTTYKVAPKGIKIIHYDKLTQKQDGTIIAALKLTYSNERTSCGFLNWPLCAL